MQEAHELLKSDVDVRIGFIETHNRKETAALVEGIKEMDLEGFLKADVVLEDLFFG